MCKLAAYYCPISLNFAHSPPFQHKRSLKIFFFELTKMHVKMVY
jgi:hypothetical protein